MRRVSAGRLFAAMAFGVLGAALSLGLDAAISYLREDWTNPIGIGLAVGLASITGLIPLLQGQKPPLQERPPRSQSGYPPPRPGYPPPWQPRPPRPPPARVPVFLAILVLLLVCGGGAGALAVGAQYVGGWVTGDEDGVDVLAAEKSAKAGPLTLTVHRVRLTAHFTRVEMSAANSGDTSLTLPIFGYCQVTVQGGRTLEGDSFRSDWPQTVPAEGLVRGTVNFGRLPDRTTRMSVSFTTVFGPGANSVTIRDITLTVSG
jgi:hypothetical protein